MTIIKFKKKNFQLKTVVFYSISIFMLIFAASISIFAQETDQIDLDLEKIEKKPESETRFQIRAEADFEYNDNVFRLDDSLKSKMSKSESSDSAGARFKDMESPWDIIVSPEVRIDFKTPGPFGSKFQAVPEFKYNIFTRNIKKRYPEGKLELRQSIGKNGRLKLENMFQYKFFRRNYLSGANDLNSNGNIPVAERVYSSAIYNEGEIRLAYRHRFLKTKKTTIGWINPGLSIQPLLGIRGRRYDSPFGNRDRNVMLAGIEILLKLNRKIDIDLGYRYEIVKCPNKEELILLDETVDGFNQDMNNDGVFRGNAPLITKIYRSRDQHLLNFEFSMDFIKNWRAFCGYRLRLLTYDSPNKLDVEHYKEDERRQRLSLGIRCRFKKRWFAGIEYKRTDDYSYDGHYIENRIIALLRHRFI